MENVMSIYYDKKLIWRYLFFMIALIAMMMATKGMVTLLLLVLLMFYAAMKKPEKLLFIILISSSFMMMNGTLAPKGLVAAASIKVQMVVASVLLAGYIFGRKHPNVLSPMMGIIPYLLFMILPSGQGWCPPISYLKLFLFTMVFLSYYGCAISVMNTPGGAKTLRSMMLAMSILFVFGSLAVYPIPSISQMDYELLKHSHVDSYYQGLTNHSQALGVLMAVFGEMIYADMLFNLQRANKLYVALIICSAILIYMTACRTALASLIAGIGFSTFIAMTAKGVKRSWRGKVVSVMLVMATISSMAVLIVPSMRSGAVKFVVKHGGEDATTQIEGNDVFMSRRGKWDETLYNWRQKPAIGNGFQVSEEMAYKKVDGIRDMISAPIEKGTWPYAILEEGGVIGLTLFILFLMQAFFSWHKRKAYVGMSIFFTFVMCNFGEFSLFSMSMDGGLFWFLAFFGLILDWKRIKDLQSPIYYRV